MKKYKIHILLLRALVILIPILILRILDFFYHKLDNFCNWLADILPDPKK